jgi:hypothetical protein
MSFLLFPNPQRLQTMMLLFVPNAAPHITGLAIFKMASVLMMINMGFRKIFQNLSKIRNMKKKRNLQCHLK